MECKRKEPLLSVIIPLYNCAQVITRCLDSIDYQDSEIIVVNDGSTDGGEEIVAQYAAAHSNVQLINKKNGGVSSARNVGIDKASGQYIAFVDADDYLARGGIQYVVSLAHDLDADVVKYKSINISSDCQTVVEACMGLDEVVIEESSGKEALLRYDVPDHVIWDGIYKRSLIEKYHIRFSEDLRLHEDDVFMGKVYSHANKVIITNLRLYRYVLSSNFSWTHKQSEERTRTLIQSSCRALKYRSMYVQKYYPQAMRMEQLKYMRWLYFPHIAYKANLTIEEYLSVLNEFRSYGAYPLSYRWIKVAHSGASSVRYVKYAIKTFMCNHPRLAYFIFKIVDKK